MPIAVAVSAMPMPRLTSAGSDTPPWARAVKVCMMPKMVPNKPSSGAPVMMVSSIHSRALTRLSTWM